MGQAEFEHYQKIEDIEREKKRKLKSEDACHWAVLLFGPTGRGSGGHVRGRAETPPGGERGALRGLSCTSLGLSVQDTEEKRPDLISMMRRSAWE